MAQPSDIQSPQVQTVQSSCKDLKRLYSGTQISAIAESEDSQESVDSVTDSQNYFKEAFLQENFE